jgi:hypothetical protein
LTPIRAAAFKGLVGPRGELKVRARAPGTFFLFFVLSAWLATDHRTRPTALRETQVRGFFFNQDPPPKYFCPALLKK